MALTYGVLLIETIALTRLGAYREELGEELDDSSATLRNRRQSFWVLEPRAVPRVAAREMRTRSSVLVCPTP